MIHIVNGEEVGKRLDTADPIIIWREMYDWGPLNHTWDTDDFIGRRAAFFEERIELPSPLFIQSNKKQLASLRAIPYEEEVVLWFEHDLYDQTMLMFLLNELKGKGHNLSMVTLHAYPGIEPFYGMGQLSSEQLNRLMETRQPVTEEQESEAVEGWRAYTSKHPFSLESWIENVDHPLPYLCKAMKTHLDYHPSKEKGLRRVEELTLSLLEKEEKTFIDLFEAVKKERSEDGLSDLRFAYMLKQLQPLITFEGDPPDYKKVDADPVVSITEHGIRVLSGEWNRMDVIGIDDWVGGVRLFKRPTLAKGNASVRK
ncbi:DUF1835 domain-containing protein [Halobacillus locisalis]|uniref:DUF1835 domain-containing protein n=1 Tax=Halobacillus locisalis TaxID=220753 RepID=A0A838CWS6_9BACI|nr:DUF1835 domain-containing protein [Halobacillus locisalis]MBA2176378.1 DUF1835 domain-containing protein [Halobacillus locisalis]